MRLSFSFSSLVVPVLLARLSAGAIFNNVADLQKVKTSFDFIVVGGGTSGSVIANRLSENPAFSVLVLEAGGTNEGNLLIQAPYLCLIASPFSPVDWNYTTTTQPGLAGRSIPYPRGFVLGGSSSTNYLVYTRGAASDWNRFATIAGDQRWSWNSLQPYITKNERFTQPADHHNISAQFTPAVHGFTGMNSVSLSGFPTEIDSKIISVTQTDKANFPFNTDMNSGSTLGIGYTQMTSLNGTRSSAATSYLGPNYIKRSNLNVVLNARVKRVIPTAANDFRTVEFVDATGKTFNFTAKNEVVLSAGAVNTPSILLHSGIGDFSALAKVGVKGLVNLPSVGQNLSDHGLLAPGFPVNSNNTNDRLFQDPAFLNSAIAEWSATKQGILTRDPVPFLGFFRIPNSPGFAALGPDQSAGSDAGHYEILFANEYVGVTPPTGSFFGITLAVVSPASRGSITIGSSDPLAAPLINPNLLGDPKGMDLFIMRTALKKAFTFAQKSQFSDYIIGEPAGVSSTDTDAQMNTYIKANTGTVFHPVGTASVSPVGAKWGVVDPDLKVKGVKGLRIVDLSVMPRVPAAHTQAAAYIIGERGADFIKADCK